VGEFSSCRANKRDSVPELTAVRRTVTSIALAGVAIVAFARNTPAIITNADFAVTEIYTELAIRGQLFVGPYSRFGWHHPGPLYFYLQAPLYALGGHKAAALYATALAMNLGAIGVTAWVIRRWNRGALLLLVTTVCVIFAWRAPRFLASPWTAHVPVLPSLTFIALCSAVIAGDVCLLPLALAFATFIAQTHVAFVPIVGVLSVTVTLFLIFGERGDRRSLQPRDYALSALVIAVWLPPAFEALRNSGGNLAALWQFFVTDAGSGHSLKESVVTWSYGLTGIFRPDFQLGWGGHVVLRYLPVAIPCAVLQVALLLMIAWREMAAGRRFDGAMALSTALVSITSLLALARIRDDILDHELFWIAAFGAFNLAVLSASGLRSLIRLIGQRTTAAGTVSMLGCVTALMMAVAVGIHHLWDFTGFELRRRQERRVILRVYEAMHGYIAEYGSQRPLVTIDGSHWATAAGVLLRVLQDGTRLAVDDASIPIFTAAFRATGLEDATITISGSSLHEELRRRPSNVTVFEAPPIYVDAIKTRTR
jgi:hypothetical protein